MQWLDPVSGHSYFQPMDTPTEPLTRDQAVSLFRQLVAQYGLQWRADVPRSAHEQLRRCNAVLNTSDRRQALGLPC